MVGDSRLYWWFILYTLPDWRDSTCRLYAGEGDGSREEVPHDGAVARGGQTAAAHPGPGPATRL